MIGSHVVRFLEKRMLPKFPEYRIKNTSSFQQEYGPLRDNSRVIIIGGGIAGSSLARQLLLLAQQGRIKIKVILVNSTNCNYCGGLVTNLALQTMVEKYHLDMPKEVSLQRVQECVYLNPHGSVQVQLNKPLTGALRTSRFGLPGFDDSIKQRILDGIDSSLVERLEVIEPTIVTHVEQFESKPNWKVTLSKVGPDGQPIHLTADVVVMAGGFRSLNRPMMRQFMQVTGFEPPPTLPASVTEIDTSSARLNTIAGRMFIVDGILPDVVLAFIPKSKDWLTLTALGKRLSMENLSQIFNHPTVKRFVDLPNVTQCLRCHTICGAKVFTGPAKKFYGNGWAVLGDLTGYGRVLKDGYYASFLGAYLLAHTLVYRGCSSQDFAAGYQRPLKRFTGDNKVGMTLFRLNEKLQRKPWFGNYLIQVLQWEKEKDRYGSWCHGAIRALATGELPYRVTALLFIVGIMTRLLLNPIHSLRILSKSIKRTNKS